MNATLIAELEKLNDQYPFRSFELETRDGRRIRITQRFHKLWTSEEKKDGDIKIENGMIAFLRYDDLEDVIHFVPWWRRPFSWIGNHPEWFCIPLVFFSWGLLIGCGVSTCAYNAGTAAKTEHKSHD